MTDKHDPLPINSELRRAFREYQAQKELLLAREQMKNSIGLTDPSSTFIESDGRTVDLVFEEPIVRLTMKPKEAMELAGNVKSIAKQCRALRKKKHNRDK